MKKTWISILVAGLMLFFSFSAYADQEIEIKMIIDNPKVLVNGREVVLDVPPTVMNGRTLVPIRFISETLGALVEYDAPTRTVTIRMPNLKIIKEKLLQLEQKLEELIENHKKEVQELKEELEASEQTIAELTASIETITDEYQQKIQQLENQIINLEAYVQELEDQLANADKSLDEETNPPTITLENLSQGQNISEELILRGNIEDESPIAFVRVRLGSRWIHEGKEIGGTISPYQLSSGNYTVRVEAMDAFGNVGYKDIDIIIANIPKEEPVKLSSKIMDFHAMGGTAYLYVSVINKSSSYLEILNVEVFKTNGDRFEVMPGVGLVDAMMMQFEMKHLMLHHDDNISLPVALDMENSGKPAKEYFKDWKIKVTYFDPIMEKELMLETTYKG